MKREFDWSNYYRRLLIDSVSRIRAGRKMFGATFDSHEQDVIALGVFQAQDDAKKSLDNIGGMAGVW